MVMFLTFFFNKIEYVNQENDRSLTDGIFKIEKDFLIHKIAELDNAEDDRLLQRGSEIVSKASPKVPHTVKNRMRIDAQLLSVFVC